MSATTNLATTEPVTSVHAPCSRRSSEQTDAHEPAASESWAELLHRFADETAALRRRAEAPQGPLAVALRAVDEAVLAGSLIAEAMSQPSAASSAASSAAAPAPSDAPTLAEPGIDYRRLERRTRALRSALESLDDYVWWGGLSHGG